MTIGGLGPKSREWGMALDHVEEATVVLANSSIVQVSEDDGRAWRRIDRFPGVPETTYVSCLLASQHEADTVFASFDNHKRGDFKPYLFRSPNRGKDWVNIAGDLLVHLVSGMMFMLGINEQPNRVQALGNIIRWKDGRNMPDVHAALYEYPSLQAPVYLRLNLGGASPETYRFYGSKGTLEVTEYEIKYLPQTGENDSP